MSQSSASTPAQASCAHSWQSEHLIHLSPDFEFEYESQQKMQRASSSLSSSEVSDDSTTLFCLFSQLGVGILFRLGLLFFLEWPGSTKTNFLFRPTGFRLPFIWESNSVLYGLSVKIAAFPRFTFLVDFFLSQVGIFRMSLGEMEKFSAFSLVSWPLDVFAS